MQDDQHDSETPQTEVMSAPSASLETNPVEPAAPNIAPALAVAPATTPSDISVQKSSPGVIVLQWLTYAFWGWLILGLVWLTGVVATNFIAGADVDGMIPYAIAATVVLLPIAFLTDLFYRKQEPAKKSGVATVIMVIHAVIFALFGIGALVCAVFTVLSLFLGTNSEGSKYQISFIITELVAVFLYAIVFFRTLNPLKDSTKKVAAIYAYGMLILSIVILGLGVFGPMLKAISERDDRRIETNLPSVQTAIGKYVQTSDKLPETLDDVDYKDQDVESLVKDGLVRYEKVSSPSQPSLSSGGSFNRYSSNSSNAVYEEYRYKLCVTYKGSKESRYYNQDSAQYGDEYDSYLSVYSHPAGEVCYKLKAESY